MQGELVSLWQRSGFTALLVTHDVEEALFLAGRVIVLSQRPAHISAEIVNPRPEASSNSSATRCSNLSFLSPGAFGSSVEQAEQPEFSLPV